MVGSKVGAKNMKNHKKMVPKVKQKVANWNQKGPTLSQRATKMQNKTRTRKSRPPEKWKNMVLGATWSIWGWIWAPTGF